MSEVIERLTGSELLYHVERQLTAGYTRDDAARTAGYIKGKLERTDKVGFELAFYQALGYNIPKNTTATAVRKRKPAGEVSVHKGGGTALSSAYMIAIGAQPGDKFEVVAEDGVITLTLMAGSEDEGGYDESEDADCTETSRELVAA